MPKNREVATAVDLEKIRLLFGNVGLSQSVVVTNASLLVFLLGGVDPPHWAVVWWLLVVMLAGFRYAVARRFLAGGVNAVAARVWRRRVLAQVLAAACLWSVGGAAMMMADPATTRLFVALVLAGMVVGAMPLLSSVPLAFRIFAIPVMCSIILTALLDAHGNQDRMLALVAGLYLLAVLQSSRYFHDSLDNSLRMAAEMRGMAERLRAALGDAEAASQSRSRFLATVSHEIRTPLNGVLGMAQLLLMPDVKDSERLEYARTILVSGRTLLTLLNDILDLSRVEAGKLTLVPAACAPEQLLHETGVLFREPAREKGLELAQHWSGPAEQRYFLDAQRLRQMLANLTGNAIKFTRQGGIRIEGREAGREDGVAILEFSVIDTGIGIPADKLSLLFQPFSQLDDPLTRENGGSGLGLSIVRNLAQLMGGEAGCTSEAGSGSRFWFRVRAGLIEPDADTRAAIREMTA